MKNNPNLLPDHSRQLFVKSMVATTASLAASQFAFSGLNAEDLATKTLKIGVVGMGGRGTGAVMNSLSADPNVQLWAAGEIFEQQLTKSLEKITTRFSDRVQVPKERQFVGFDAYQKVIDSGVDLVILTTSPAFRPLHLKAAVAAGKHVFAEKPLAVDTNGLKSVIETAKKAKAAGISIMTGLVWRYTAALQEMHAKIGAGEIGSITYASSTYCGGGRPNKLPPAKFRPPQINDMEWAMRYWQNYVEFSGDGILEFMVHGIDKLSWAMGDRQPVSCYANGGNAVPHEGSNNWDNFSLFFEYADGSRANFMGRQIPKTDAPSGDYIVGTKGQAGLNSNAYISKDGNIVWSKDKGNLGYDEEHKLLLDTIRKGGTYNDILGKMEVSHSMAMMGRAAAYTGKVITWDDFMKSDERFFDMENISFSTPFTPRATACQGITPLV